MDGKNWEKQVYPSLSHFGREKQVLDGKNPTLIKIKLYFDCIQQIYSLLYYTYKAYVVFI